MKKAIKNESNLLISEQENPTVSFFKIQFCEGSDMQKLSSVFKIEN